MAQDEGTVKVDAKPLYALGVAARCWTDPETSGIEMDERLARAFARRVEGYLTIIEEAWGIIANAGDGDWGRAGRDEITTAAREWREAAERWRDERWHRLLEHDGDPG